ncbi:MAG TPA: ATP-binding protein [Myxococcaceae bacterium]
MSGRPISVLVVENHEDDAELMIEQLRKGGFEPEWQRVEGAEEMRRALQARPWDIILSDYVMPRFSGADALNVLKQTGLDLPFIIVSGRIGEEVAVQAMKLGAQDFFRKDRLTLLAAAVQRELKEAEVRHERRRMEMALQQSESERAHVLNSIRDYAIFTLDLLGRIQSWNPGVERVKGYRAEEFIGMAFARLFLPEDAAAGIPEEELRQARKDGLYEGEGWRLRKDGTRFWAEVSLTPRFGPGGELQGYTKVTHDISERKRLIEELRSAVRLRDEFLSIAAHELRTPLTSLKLQLQSLEPLAHGVAVSVSEASPIPRKLGAVSRQVDRLAQLTESLLDVSRISSGQLELRKEPVELVELVREVASRLDLVRETSGCTLNVEAPRPVMGTFDRLRIDSVVVNLLSNAFKFGAGKPVDVTVEAREGNAVLTVRDQGIGISEENQSRIFERFERAVPETQYGGFGIGLWIVRRVVEAHGGRITVKSQVGQGTTFIVTLGGVHPPHAP